MKQGEYGRIEQNKSADVSSIPDNLRKIFVGAQRGKKCCKVRKFNEKRNIADTRFKAGNRDFAKTDFKLRFNSIRRGVNPT